MTTEEKLEMYREKKRFIIDIASALCSNPKGHTVDTIAYEVFCKELNGERYFNEWIIVRFNGGGTSHRSVTGNSNIANFRVIADLIPGGYYADWQWYERQVERGYTKVDLDTVNTTKE